MPRLGLLDFQVRDLWGKGLPPQKQDQGPFLPPADSRVNPNPHREDVPVKAAAACRGGVRVP